MGKYTNRPIQNIIGWGTVIILTGLSMTMFILPLFT
jgi:Mn2+/Fe2+ NRAMP family transporter